jgi:AcrR family transcriptional regulator
MAAHRGREGHTAARGGAAAARLVSRSQVAEIQRSRLLAAAVAALEEQGYEHTSVADITTRARVSRRTFYELFASREECLAAVLTDTATQLARELRDAGVPALPWRERMRLGLWTVLCFLDREPALGRALVVHSLRGSGPVVQAREAILAQLLAAVDAGRREGRRGGRTRGGPAAGPSALTSEGIVGAVLSILQTRLASSGSLLVGGEGARVGRAPDGGHSPVAIRVPRARAVRDLLGELTAIVLLPYEGAAVARREQAKPAPAVPARAERPTMLGEPDPLAGLPMRMTYRTARILDGIAAQPGASNRQAAQYAGIADQGQASKLLARLQGLGLLENHGAGRAKGEPNSWALTATGLQVAQSLNGHATAGTRSGRTDATREKHP